MAFIEVVVTPDDGEPYRVDIGTRDVLAWEKGGRNRSMSGLVENMHMADIYAVTHIAAKRRQLFPGDLAKFEETVDIQVKKIAEDGPDPIQQAP